MAGPLREVVIVVRREGKLDVVLLGTDGGEEAVTAATALADVLVAEQALSSDVGALVVDVVTALVRPAVKCVELPARI